MFGVDEKDREQQARDDISKAKLAKGLAIPATLISFLFLLVGLGFLDRLSKPELMLAMFVLIGVLAVACNELFKISTRLIKVSEQTITEVNRNKANK